jgi:hypothetical protein
VHQTNSGSVGTVWAKAGTAVPWDWFLGAEVDNGWTGWFDSGETLQTGAEFGKAQGTVLEGTLDLAALYGSAPGTIWLAAAAYATPDGGVLMRQAPAGDGDGDLEPPEYYALSGLSAIGETVPPARSLRMSLSPNPFNPSVAVRLEIPHAGSVRVDVYDLQGKRMATLLDGPVAPGPAVLRWNGRRDDGSPCPSGVYLFLARGEGRRAAARGALLK